MSTLTPEQEFDIDEYMKKVENHVNYFSLPKKLKELKPRKMADKIELMIYRLKKKGVWKNDFGK